MSAGSAWVWRSMPRWRARAATSARTLQLTWKRYRSACPGFAAPRTASDAGELGNLAGTGTPVETLGVAALALLQARLDVDFLEFSAHDVAHHLAFGAERRDERGDHDQPGVHHDLGNLGRTPQVLAPCLLGEAEVAVQAVAQGIAVEHERGDRRAAVRAPAGARRWTCRSRTGRSSTARRRGDRRGTRATRG